MHENYIWNKLNYIKFLITIILLFKSELLFTI